MDHYIDKHAIANEEFRFECMNCGNQMTTTPGAPGTAQSKCKKCGHIMLYHVDKSPIKKKEHNPLCVKLSPSKKFPGDYQINEPLSLNKSYYFMCPKCSKIHKIQPKETGERGVSIGSCSFNIYFKVQKNQPIPTDTDRVGGSSNTQAKAYIEFYERDRWWKICHKVMVNLDEDLTIIGRNIHKKPCDFEKSGCKSCWRRDKHNVKYPCDILIKDKYMSACSMEIKKEISASGGVTFKATILRASNDLQIQRRTYPVNSSIYLKDGDIIKMGKTTITFKLKKDKT